MLFFYFTFFTWCFLLGIPRKYLKTAPPMPWLATHLAKGVCYKPVLVASGGEHQVEDDGQHLRRRKKLTVEEGGCLPWRRRWRRWWQPPRPLRLCLIFQDPEVGMYLYRSGEEIYLREKLPPDCSRPKLRRFQMSLSWRSHSSADQD